jgi:8-oxo-dGTP diphosphatase
MKCYVCGLNAKEEYKHYYSCPKHGMLYLLSRNGPCADALITKENNILLILRAHDPYAGYWALPGGFQELGEHPAKTAIREAREETGLIIKLESLLGIYVREINPGEYRQTVVYVAKPLRGKPKAGDDANDCQWFPIDQLPINTSPAHLKRITDYRGKRLSLF